MQLIRRFRKSFIFFLCFTLMASWGSALGLPKASAAGASTAPMNQPMEHLYDGAEVVFDQEQNLVSEEVATGFEFDFYGDIYEGVYVSKKGNIYLKDESNNIRGEISPFSSDDLTYGPKSKVLYSTIGAAPNRKFIVQYTNVLLNGYVNDLDPLGTFQVVLYEGSNEIQFQYPNLVGYTFGDRAFGSNSWIAIYSNSNEEDVSYSDYEKSLKEKQAIRFIPGVDYEYTLVGDAEYDPILLLPALYPKVPLLVGPADGEYATAAVPFHWNSTDGADSYRILIATDADFVNVVRDQKGITQTSYAFGQLQEGQGYYWKVVALNDTGYTFSNTSRFIVPLDYSGYESPIPPVEALEDGINISFDNEDDGVSEALSIGFDFSFYGESHSEIFANTNGLLTFNNPTSSCCNSNDALPLTMENSSVDHFITAFYDDLIMGQGTKVLYKTIGESPNRKFVIQYTNMMEYGNDNNTPIGTAQVILHEGTNEIQVQYPYLIALGTSSDVAFGSDALIGIQGLSGNFVVYSQAKKSLHEKLAIRFTPDGQGSYTLTAGANYDPILLIPNGFPESPKLIAPAYGKQVPNDPTLEWSSTNGANQYLLLVATDSEFKNVVYQGPSADTSFLISDLNEGENYYWRVVAFNDVGFYTFSSTYRFYKHLDLIVTTDSSVDGITAMSAAVGGNVTVDGNSTVAERGIVYSLEANPTLKDFRAKANEGGEGAFTVELTGLQSFTTYYARAYAVDGLGISYGDEVAFTTLGSYASLDALDLSGITLDQPVIGSVYGYTASVKNTVSSTTLAATVNESVYGSVTASVYNDTNTRLVGPIHLASGETSSSIPLIVGINKIVIAITSMDGSVTSYAVTVTREAATVTEPETGTESPGTGGGSSNELVTATNGKLKLPVGKAGKVSVEDGSIVVSIPANAISKQLELTIEKVVNTQALLGNKEILASSVFELLKNFTDNFNKPVTITLSFDPAKLKSGQTAAVFYYDELAKVWVNIKSGIISGNRISAEVDHFTKFAVLVVDEATGLPITEPSTDASFSDVAGHWAEVNIKQAVQNGMVSGYPDGTFKPNATITRAEFAVMLMNAVKSNDDGYKLTFKDTAKIGAWAQKAVAQAVKANLINGYEDGTFRPNANLTRAELAVIIANALKLSSETNADTSFADNKDIPQWARGAVSALHELGLVTGKGANKFEPKATTTRAEAVTVLLRMLAQESN
ncbi:S-layer homology domain-containing protein [Paenibacillus luteus]|uniref:S-layer homology domain-containing protein n=1 Tax=Paenibacillus luteus TaxID=2545753 RepID=UPI00114385AA|nr:S-layer homology domain-containing protein [Paenibacillus luteus]